jgi:hypothetical protein
MDPEMGRGGRQDEQEGGSHARRWREAVPAGRVESMKSRRTVVLLVVLALGVFPALALASPTDPLWIGGVYDGGDWDDAVLASAFSDGVAGATGPKDLWTSWIAVGTVQLGWPGPPTRFALPAFDGRAPPAA